MASDVQIAQESPRVCLAVGFLEYYMDRILVWWLPLWI